MNIKGKKVTLRAIEKEDLELMRNMLNDPEMESLVVGWAFPISRYQQEKWYENNINNMNNLRFIIETKEDGAIGLITLTEIDWKNRKAINGIKILEKNSRKKGIGIDSLMAIMRYCFDELQLHRLETTRFLDNIASEKLYNKCGWKEEGIKRECIYKNGKWRDLVFTGILKSDYLKLVEETKYWEK